MITARPQSNRFFLHAAVYLFCSIALSILMYSFLLLPKEKHAITLLHANVAYNFYHHNSPNINSTLADTLWQDAKHKEITQIDFNTYDVTTYKKPNKPFPVNDTIGYGLLIGFLWKCTNSLSLFDIVILQMILYLLMIFLSNL